MKTSQEKESKAMDLFNIHYEELCDPDKKHVREALKSKTLDKLDNSHTGTPGESSNPSIAMSNMGVRGSRERPAQKSSQEIVNEIEKLKCPYCYECFENSKEAKEHFTATGHRGNYDNDLNIDKLDELIMWKQSDVKMEIKEVRKSERLECYKKELDKFENPKLIEILADLEHKQWIEWSKAIAGADERISEDRLDKWAGLWIPYKKLSEENKEKDRIWARKVLEVFREEISQLQAEIKILEGGK